jgi:alkylation response protein AidB-like acyl-CoA dehydrogenase
MSQSSKVVVIEPHPAPDVLIARGQALVPVLRQRSRDCEVERRIPAETIDDFRRAGFYRIAQPTAFGGFAMGVDVVAEVAMQVGRGCGSSAWMAAQYPGHQFMVGFFPLEAQQEYWADSPDTLSSTASAVARINCQPERGGWRVRDTHMRFSSGCDWAEWILFVTPQGTALIPKSDFRILDDWQVAGLRGTGSKSILIDDAWVPPHRIVPMSALKEGTTYGARLYPDMPFYRVPQTMVLHQLLLAPQIGMARGVLELFEERVTKRIDLHTGKPASEGAGAQLRFAESAAEVDAAEMFIRRNCATLVRWGTTEHQPDDNERALMRRDITYASRLATRAAERLLTAGDASAMFDTHPIARLGRDLHMAHVHATQTWDEPAQTYARLRWGLPPSSLLN